MKYINNIYEEKTSYIKVFDIYRVLALLFVVLYHLMPNKFSGGFYAVNIFFVLAGFLAMHKLYDDDDTATNIELICSLKRKFKKLSIPLLTMISILIIFIAIYIPMQIEAQKNIAIASAFWVNNIYQIVKKYSYFEHFGVLNPFNHIWALSIEMQFYILFILCRYPIKKYKDKNLFLFILSVLSIVSAFLMFFLYYKAPEINMNRVYLGTDTRAFSFLLGMIAKITSKRFKNKFNKNEKRSYSIISYILILVAIIPCCICKNNVFTFYGGMFIYSCFIAFSFFFFDIHSELLANISNLNIIKYFVSRSYIIYLWHYSLLIILEYITAFWGITTFQFIVIYLVILFILEEIMYFINKLLNEQISKNNKFSKITISIFLIFIVLFPCKYFAVDVDSNKLKGERIIDTQNIFIHSTPSQISIINTIEDANFKDDNIINSLDDNAINPSYNSKPYLKQYPIEPIKKVEEAENKKTLPIIYEEGTYKGKSIISNGVISMSTDMDFKEENYPTLKSVFDLIKIVNNTAVNDMYIPLNEYVKFRELQLSMIGDSLTSGTSKTLLEYMPNATINGKPLRRIQDAPVLQDELILSGKLGDGLVIALGSNDWEINTDPLEVIYVKMCGKPLFLVNLFLPGRSNEEARNKKLIDFANTHSNVYIIDWNRVSKQHPEYFTSDHVHPSMNGAKYFAQTIVASIIGMMG